MIYPNAEERATAHVRLWANCRLMHRNKVAKITSSARASSVVWRLETQRPAVGPDDPLAICAASAGKQAPRALRSMAAPICGVGHGIHFCTSFAGTRIIARVTDNSIGLPCPSRLILSVTLVLAGRHLSIA